MAWERRGHRLFYYRGIRQDGRVRKIYCGGGLAGLAALDADLRRREEPQAVAWLTLRRTLDEIANLSRRLRERCDLLAHAVLLAAGFHRPNRVQWRRWHAARRAVQPSTRTRRPR